MMHELKRIISAFEAATTQRKSCILATVVALEGSSYRRPGVRMLIREDGKMIGAVSGGCVEKEVFRQAESVFRDGVPKVMTYDGRYRLGCEGILYILLEPFQLPRATLEQFKENLGERTPLLVKSHFQRLHGTSENFGSYFEVGGKWYPFRKEVLTEKNDAEIYEQHVPPCFRLVIVGAEHDTVQLVALAAGLGWEVTVVTEAKEEKQKADFPGTTYFIANDSDTPQLRIDSETAVLLMTHSFVKDLKYLIALKEQYPAYFGLLGPARRREKLFDALLEQESDIEPDFLSQIHGPTGLDIGAETPEEIAVSILAEILAATRKKTVIPLREKLGNIHAR
ncbi:MAG: XdhC/CoxI family protein [Bacteroidota bacterium]